ncbi:heat shock protein, putative [Pediculus humanus corporis]|uniref:Heat shock protein, putative n=1 Tax=Pediculus humanus subsp. corporis TaxID=121224 RepID=E0VHY3_PEDHC|nr:heat shock protein, putative [Pediculus humanus corporis]EEB12989.1 heat shock protein, putative [Pediculus humanus corporis]
MINTKSSRSHTSETTSTSTVTETTRSGSDHSSTNKLKDFEETFSSTTSNTSTSSSQDGRGGELANTWYDGLNSPLIQDQGDNKMLKLRFDVSQYQPEEIVVKTVDNKLLAAVVERTVSVKDFPKPEIPPSGFTSVSSSSGLGCDVMEFEKFLLKKEDKTGGGGGKK